MAFTANKVNASNVAIFFIGDYNSGFKNPNLKYYSIKSNDCSTKSSEGIPKASIQGDICV